jgi:hypothetical protein
MPKLDSLSDLLLHLLLDALRFIRLSLRPHCALAAENLFLRKQLALFRERKIKARRASDASRLTLVLLSCLFAWRQALTIVQPDRHFHPLASERLSAVLEVEIETTRTAASSCRTTETDCRDG